MGKEKTKEKENRNRSPMRKDLILAKVMGTIPKTLGVQKEIHGRTHPGTVVETILEKVANHTKVERARILERART